MIKQIVDAPKSVADDTYTVDGLPLFNIKLVATVEAKEEHQTNYNYTVSDGSGSIECKKWRESDQQGDDDNHKCMYVFSLPTKARFLVTILYIFYLVWDPLSEYVETSESMKAVAAF